MLKYATKDPGPAFSVSYQTLEKVSKRERETLWDEPLSIHGFGLRFREGGVARRGRGVGEKKPAF
jgi:hypothetical protein